MKQAWQQAEHLVSQAVAYEAARKCRRNYHADSSQDAIVERTYANLVRAAEDLVAQHRVQNEDMYEVAAQISESLPKTRRRTDRPDLWEQQTMLMDALGVEWRGKDITRVEVHITPNSVPEVHVTRMLFTGSGLNPPELKRVQEIMQLVPKSPEGERGN